MNDPITVTGVALSAVVAVAMLVVVVRVAKQRLFAAVGILAAGAFGALCGAAWFGVVGEVAGGGSTLTLAAGAVCGFAWFAAAAAAIAQRAAKAPAGKPLAEAAGSAVLRVFAILFGLASMPGLFGVIGAIAGAVSNRSDAALAGFLLGAAVSSMFMFLIPAVLAWLLWRAAGRRRAAASPRPGAS